MNILNKIKKAGLVGRGGACFPTADKWQMVKEAPGRTKYVVCNAAEGEPGVKKDGYILENFAEKVIAGIKIAIDFLGAAKGIIYINHKYYKKYNKKLKKIIEKTPIEFFVKPIEAGYIGGAESSMLNAIEGKRVEPRLRPPFPTTSGLWGCPTLVNNVETFYNVSLVATSEYKKYRFYTINGDCLHTGVYNFLESWTIERILKETGNKPKFPFFVQVGGDASGLVLNSQQLKRRVDGAGSITVYSVVKNKPRYLVKRWLNFFLDESCGQCTPCREGVYRLLEIINSPKPNWQLFSDLLENLNTTALCAFGHSVPTPIESYIKNVLTNMPDSKTGLSSGAGKALSRYF